MITIVVFVCLFRELQRGCCTGLEGSHMKSSQLLSIKNFLKGSISPSLFCADSNCSTELHYYNTTVLQYSTTVLCAEILRYRGTKLSCWH